MWLYLKQGSIKVLKDLHNTVVEMKTSEEELLMLKQDRSKTSPQQCGALKITQGAQHSF